MAYDPVTVKDLKVLHRIAADCSDALRKLIETMETFEAESVELQIRELRKRLLLHVEPVTPQLKQAAADVEAGSAKGLVYVKSRKK